MQANLEQAEEQIKRFEAFLTTMEANDEKLNGILQFAKRLTEEGHYAADKIQKKAENIAERRENNRCVIASRHAIDCRFGGG